MPRKPGPRARDVTATLRRMAIEDGTDMTCIGCGARAPEGRPFLGTSRWNAKAALCTPCCEIEAAASLSGQTWRRDPFGTAALPGGCKEAP